MDGDLVYCNNIWELMEELPLEHTFKATGAFHQFIQGQLEGNVTLQWK
jgi:hypothetical protein